MSEAKEPIPNFLTNGILVYFLYDHRFLFIQKKYSPNKQNWFFKPKKIKLDHKDTPEYIEDSYYVNKHKEVVKIDSKNNTIKRPEDPKLKYETLIPDTDIWIGLLRAPITEGNLKMYYYGKYTSLKMTYGGFLTSYLTKLKSSYVTRTKNIINKEDVIVERWYIYPDIPPNQSIFIL